MSRNQLRHLRIMLVGMFALISILSLFAPLTSLPALIELADIRGGLASLAAVTLLGVGYYQLGVRDWIEPSLWKDINRRIHEGIISAAGEHGLIVSQAATMRVFYRIVDNDATLKSHSEKVYFNGLVVTGLVDASIIALAFSIVHSVLSIAGVGDRVDHFIWALALLALDIAASIAAIGALRRHQQLSDAQLEIITSHHTDDATRMLADELRLLR